MRIVVNKHWRVFLDFGRVDSLSLQLYWTYHRLLQMRGSVNSHALPVYKQNRIASLLCIFETIIYGCIYNYICEPRTLTVELIYSLFQRVYYIVPYKYVIFKPRKVDYPIEILVRKHQLLIRVFRLPRRWTPYNETPLGGGTPYKENCACAVHCCITPPLVLWWVM